MDTSIGATRELTPDAPLRPDEVEVKVRCCELHFMMALKGSNRAQRPAARHALRRLPNAFVGPQKQTRHANPTD